MKLIDSFKTKFEVNRFLIKEYKYWFWFLRKEQSTLGSCILLPKNEYSSLSELTESDLLELKPIITEIENRLFSLFKYSKINYLTLMMVDPIVHTHIIPRYEKPVKYEGEYYRDKNFPYVPDLKIDLVEDSVKQNILVDLKNEI